MKHTREQLDGMSDFEINKVLASLQPYTNIIGTGEYPSQSESAVHVEQRKFKYGNIEEFGIDYCNNCSDIMPLAFEHGISIIQSEVNKEMGNWCACHEVVQLHGEFECGLSFCTSNPQRAIACCLIMVLEAKV